MLNSIDPAGIENQWECINVHPNIILITSYGDFVFKRDDIFILEGEDLMDLKYLKKSLKQFDEIHTVRHIGRVFQIGYK